MRARILVGDCIARMRDIPDASVSCCVTSPPYWGLRDYGVDGQIGLEETPSAYVERLVAVFREVRRCLRDDGTLWLNLGDSYAGSSSSGTSDGRSSTLGPKRDGLPGNKAWMVPHGAKSVPTGLKPKDLVGIPWRVAFALQADGWWLRSDIVWSKPNPMPESVTDRPTKAHEYVFLLAKSERYYFDAEAIAEPVAPSTVARLAQPTLEQQAGSDRVPGKTNGNMKACAPRFGGKKYGENDSEEYRTKSGNEYVLTESRNARTVWEITTQPFSGAHFATMPPALAERCIRAGSAEGGTILDPFGGAGTTALVAAKLGRDSIVTELNPEYARIAQRRIEDAMGLLCPVSVEP